MKITKTPLEGLVIVEPTVHADHRGFFLETFQAERYRQSGIGPDFVQDNHSKSQRHTLRGLHFQIEKPQGKLVWVLSGSVFDVAVDLRRGSPTFKRWFGITLTSESKQQLFVPPGFGHGFVVQSETAEFYYKCTAYYDPKDEGGIVWDDPDLAIDWPVQSPVLSAKDAALPRLAAAVLPRT